MLVSVRDVYRGSDQLGVDPVQMERRGGVVRVIFRRCRHSADNKEESLLIKTK